MNEMNGAPKVSLIIPVYNVEKFLEKCLDSALSQTLHPIELICVDDGSTDSSPEILARYARSHENLHVIHKENGGLSSARNAGLDAAAGEYIFFLDSDDRLSGPDALAGLYETAARRDLDLLVFGAELTYESEEIRKTASESPQHYHRRGTYSETADGPSLFCAFVENGDFRANACLLLYRRRFLESHQFRFVNGLLHEDDVFTTQCLCTASRAFYTPATPYARLIRAGSIITAESQLRRARGYCLGAHILREFYRQNLRDADKRFKRCYFRRLWEIVERAGALWRTAPSAERREYLRGLPPEEARAIRRWLAAGIPLARIRPLRRRLHRALRRAPRH